MTVCLQPRHNRPCMSVKLVPGGCPDKHQHDPMMASAPCGKHGDSHRCGRPECIANP